jgi:hypothetical protein
LALILDIIRLVSASDLTVSVLGLLHIDIHALGLLLGVRVLRLIARILRR